MYKRLNNEDYIEITQAPKITRLENEISYLKRHIKEMVDKEVKLHNMFPEITDNPLLQLFTEGDKRMYQYIGTLSILKQETLFFKQKIYKKIK